MNSLASFFGRPNKLLGRAIYRSLMNIARLPLRMGFPGRWKFIGRYINNPRFEEYWNGAPLRWTRGKVHGFWMPCDLSIFSGRSAFYMGRWYEADTQSVLLTLLRVGDVFIDIGANVGMATLTGARAIGGSGRVIAFEPNPEVVRIFAESVRRNRLDNITLHVAAFGPKAGRLPFFVPSSNHGEGSLGVDFGRRSGRTIEVKMVGPEALADLTSCRMIKIDVEGFEVSVLEGLADLIHRLQPAIITEVENQHLERCGSSAAALFRRFGELEYVGFGYGEAPLGTFKLHAVLQRIDAPSSGLGGNMLWVPAAEADRVAAMAFVGVSR